MQPTDAKPRWLVRIGIGLGVGAGLLLAAYGMLAVDRRAWRQLEAEVAAPAAAMGERLETVRRQAEPLTRATPATVPTAAGFVLAAGLDPRTMEVATFEALGAVMAAARPMLDNGLSLQPPNCVSAGSLWEKANVSDVFLGRGPEAGAGPLEKWCNEVTVCPEEPLPDVVDPRTEEALDFLEQCLMQASWGLPPMGDPTWEGQSVYPLTTEILWAGRLIVARALLRGDGATANQYLVRLAYLDAGMRAADNYGPNGYGPMSARQARQGRGRLDGLMLAVESQVGIDEATADAIAGIYRAMLLDDEDYAIHRRHVILSRAASIQHRMSIARVPSPGNTWTFFYNGKPEAVARRLLAPVVERELGAYTAALVAGEPSGADRARINSAWALYNGDPALIKTLTDLRAPVTTWGEAISADMTSINRYPERCAHIALAIAHHRRTGQWPTQEQSAELLPEAEGEFLLCTGPTGEPMALHAHRHWIVGASTVNPEHPSVRNIAGFPQATPGDLEVYRLGNPWPGLRRTIEAMLGGE